MRVILTAALLLIGGIALGQKMYIWPPNVLAPIPRGEQLRNTEINLLVNDYRILADVAKNKCTSEELTTSLFTLIKATYPAAIVVKAIDPKNPIALGKINIEINISYYYATFTSAVWFAKTGYTVKITDLRTSDKKEYSQDIYKEKKFFNVGGFSTAKNNLNKAYLEACTELIDLISDKLNN